MLLKFDKIMRQKKEIEPKTIKEIFPEDEELYKKVTEMKKRQKEEEKKLKEQLEKKGAKDKDKDKDKNNDNSNTISRLSISWLTWLILS